MDGITIATIGVIISAIGITSGFVYNAWSIQQNTRTRYYQILKDVEKEFQEIEILDHKNSVVHAMRISNFGVFLIKLANRNMIPEDYLYPPYHSIFAECLWIFNHVLIGKDSITTKEERIILEEFCKKNKIKEENPKLDSRPSRLKKLKLNKEKEFKD